MKIGLLFANTGPFVEPSGLAALATTAEAIGIESLWAIEHAAVPVGYETPYPYSRSGRMKGGDNLALPDPLLWLGYAAALTQRLKLATGVLILPQRHPIYTAKELATLDVLSEGRLIAGVGIGWLAEEFDALGIPFAERAARSEECIRGIRSLWGPGPSTFEGEHYRWRGLESNPKPVQPGGVPLVIGGHVAAAARRAAVLGNGFFPGRGDHQRLRELFDIVARECERIGRDPDEVELSAGGPLRTPDDVRAFEQLGVSRVITNIPGSDLDGMRRGLERFKTDVLDKL